MNDDHDNELDDKEIQKQLENSPTEETDQISEELSVQPSFITNDIKKINGKDRTRSKRPKMTKREKNRQRKSERKAARAKWST